MQKSKIKRDKKNYNIPIIKKIASIKNKTLGSGKGRKDGQHGYEGKQS